MWDTDSLVMFGIVVAACAVVGTKSIKRRCWRCSTFNVGRGPYCRQCGVEKAAGKVPPLAPRSKIEWAVRATLAAGIIALYFFYPDPKKSMAAAYVAAFLILLIPKEFFETKIPWGWQGIVRPSPEVCRGCGVLDMRPDGFCPKCGTKFGTRDAQEG